MRRSRRAASSAPRSAWRAYGLRPVVEVQFADYFYPACDQIVSEAARLRYRSAGDFTAPLTIRMPCGGGIYGGQTHSQSPEALVHPRQRLRTVMPSNPYDAKGLLIACIENNDPVIFLEPKRLYNGPFDGHHDKPATPWTGHALAEVPEGHYTVPLDSGRVPRRQDLTVLTYGTMVYVSEAAASESGIDAEIIDLRSIWPLDCRPSSHRSARPALRRRARGHAHQRLRRRTGRAGAGALFLPPRGADRARHRLGHAVPACAGMGVFPRSGTRGGRLATHHGGMMAQHTVKMPDLGEGITEVEVVAWHVQVGDTVAEDQVLADVMTDKATVEIPSPVAGTVTRLGGAVGDVLAVGAALIDIAEGDGDVDGDGAAASARSDATPAAAPPDRSSATADKPAVAPKPTAPKPAATVRADQVGAQATAARAAQAAQPDGPAQADNERPIASPALRRRAWELGVDLRQVRATGAGGRIMQADLDAHVARHGVQPAAAAAAAAPAAAAPGRAGEDVLQQIKVIGLRRRIAQKMQDVQAPHPAFQPMSRNAT
jgi:2-oxoisovalerate dehydrogenase E1 component beta subunit